MSNPSNQNTTSKNKPSSLAKVGIQMIKRARVDASIAVNYNFSDRQFTRPADMSHTFIAVMRRAACCVISFKLALTIRGAFQYFLNPPLKEC
jgi:hypothetical protein